MARIELNNLEDLLKNKDEIKNEKNKISKFKGKIIDEISKAFKNKIIQMIEINFLELIVSYDKDYFRDNLYIKGDYYKENNWDKSEKQLIKEILMIILLFNLNLFVKTEPNMMKLKKININMK